MSKNKSVVRRFNHEFIENLDMVAFFEEGKSEELNSFLHSLIPYISASKGCISCEVLRQKDAKDCFVVIERWESEAFHVESVAKFPKEKMQAAMGLFAGAPKGHYYYA